MYLMANIFFFLENKKKINKSCIELLKLKNTEKQILELTKSPSSVLAIEKLVKAGNTSIFDALNARWDTYAPISFMYERDTPHSKHISQELRRFYFGNQPISRESYDGIGQVSKSSKLFSSFDQCQFAKN